jgi:glyoxylase-like metal-dependent hydrolase (beta-lactamase superfamily II)
LAGRLLSEDFRISGAALKLGEIEFHIVSDGQVGLDGGAMFGVIPKPLWEKKIQPDARNRIRLELNCLLILTGGKRILVETGTGEKQDSKFRDIYAVDGPHLLDRLRNRGLKPEDIDVVVNTHLHFDHCGGNTRIGRGKVVPTFPNARYIAHKAEYEHALEPTERDRASYFVQNYGPLQDAGQLDLIDRDTEIATGVELIRVPGHTANMMCVKLSGGGKSAFFLADLIPTTAHLPIPWIMGYDLYPMVTLENKKKWIPQIVQGEWLALFGHDAVTQAAYLREKDGRLQTEPVKVD